MSPKNYQFGFAVRPAIRLSHLEEILKATRVITPVPSRPTLIALIEEGILDGRKRKDGWIVYEDSFHEWVKSFQPEAYKQVGGERSGTQVSG